MTDQGDARQLNMPDRGPQSMKGPNCWDCRHLMITWDVRKPYGCKLMGFKSKIIPSIEVLRTDGRFCGGFSAKTRPVSGDAPAQRPTQSVGNPSMRRDSDLLRPYTPVNLTT
jgi:hypothetical protein